MRCFNVAPEYYWTHNRRKLLLPVLSWVSPQQPARILHFCIESCILPREVFQCGPGICLETQESKIIVASAKLGHPPAA
eukprot:6086468-Karenia_brevis.AAC.1